jgi:hypothetical protein
MSRTVSDGVGLGSASISRMVAQPMPNLALAVVRR